MLSLLKPPHVFGPQKSWNLETSTKLHGSSQWKTRWCQKHWCCLSLVASVCIRRWSPSTNFFWTRRWKFHWVPWTARMGLLWGKNGKETSKLVLKGGEAFSNRCFKVVTREAIYEFYSSTPDFWGAFSESWKKTTVILYTQYIPYICICICMYVYNMTIDRLV